MQQLPLFFNLDRRACLVVGGGAVAERKTRILLRAGADVTVAAPALSGAIRRLALAADPGRVTLLEQALESALAPVRFDAYRLVIAASDDETVNRQVADAANAAGTWCNVVDNAALSSFIFPAIVDRSPVVIAIGTGGAAPVLAQRLKSAIEAWLPARIGELATQAGRWRKLVAKRFPAMRERLRFWQTFFDGPAAAHLLAGRRRDAERAFRAEILQPVSDEPAGVGEAWLVGAGPGDPELMTLRGQRLLARADVVLYDALVSAAILDYARKDATLVAVGKRAGGPDTQDAINDLLVQLVREGKRVCRLKGGDPFIFGRGGEEVAALAAEGLPFQVVPGITAALGTAAAAGIPLTHRGTSSSVTLATAVVDTSAEPDWPLLARRGHTLALYMSVGKAGDVSSKLIASGMPAATPAAIVQDGTLSSQRVIEGNLGNIAALAKVRGVRSPAMLFIGDTIAARQPSDRDVEIPERRRQAGFSIGRFAAFADDQRAGNVEVACGK